MLDLVCYFLRLHNKLPQIYRLKTTFIYCLSACGQKSGHTQLRSPVWSHKANIKVGDGVVPHLEAWGKFYFRLLARVTCCGCSIEVPFLPLPTVSWGPPTTGCPRASLSLWAALSAHRPDSLHSSPLLSEKTAFKGLL